MPYLKQHKDMTNFMETMVRLPKRYEPIILFLDDVIKNSEQLNWRELEMIGQEVSEAVGSRFCSDLRSCMESSLKTKGFASNLSCLIDLAKKVAKSPAEVDISLLAQIRAQGWNDQTIEDVINWASMLQVFSNIDIAFGFDTIPGEIMQDIADGTVQAGGYLPSFRYFVDQVAA